MYLWARVDGDPTPQTIAASPPRRRRGSAEYPRRRRGVVAAIYPVKTVGPHHLLIVASIFVRSARLGISASAASPQSAPEATPSVQRSLRVPLGGWDAAAAAFP